jgi:uncharacterized protein YciI
MRMLVTLLFLAALPVAAQPKYEMTTYYVVFLKRGPNSTGEVTPESTRIQKEHMAHLTKMAESGKMLLAGPFVKGGDLRGMCVYLVGSEAEAREAAEADPAVKAGRLVVEVHPWMSAKGIKTPVPSN